MTSLLEKAISVIAPHHCISCGEQNNVLCEACFADLFDESCDICFLCNKPTKDARVCPACSRKTFLRHVWIAGTYDEARRDLIRAFKFERRRAAYAPLAEAMEALLPHLEDVVVVPVPTAPLRIRVRGYDQTLLLAREIARRRGWQYASPLRRRHNKRQVGASRAARAAQASTAYELKRRSEVVSGKHVLLVDDVTTSGATLQAAAALLMAAGAARVDAVVAAKHTL